MGDQFDVIAMGRLGVDIYPQQVGVGLAEVETFAKYLGGTAVPYRYLPTREGFAIDSTMLAVLADFVPQGVGVALGKNAGGNSLDNTLRIRRIVPTDWVLCDIRISGVADGFAHGAMSLFAQDGELMATASQSLILRVHEPKPE